MSAAIWAIGEPGDDGLARVSEEVATVAASLAAAAGVEAVGIVAGAPGTTGAAADGLVRFLPRVLTLDVPAANGATWAASVAPLIANLVHAEEPAYLVVGASADGRDLAGVLSALLGWGVLTNSGGVRWGSRGPVVERSAFGGKLVMDGAFTGDRGILTLLPNSVDPAPRASAGVVSAVALDAAPAAYLPRVTVVERVAEAGAAVSLEEAKVIVTGGRGVGGPDGFAVVEQLASELGGVVGATRAAVDSGWIPYARQVGQTGRIVKPTLYVALGVSGAIQHKVGMQGAGTIVAVNRDHEAPIAEFADLLVVGDLFEVVPAVVARLRARAG